MKGNILHITSTPQTDFFFFCLQGLLPGSFVVVFLAVQQVEKGFPLELTLLAVV